MRITSLEKLMNNTSDQELLDVYVELESGKVPSTSYAHDFCRKINKMIDDGKLSVKADGFRHIYLPSLRKLAYKEMARRWAAYLQYSMSPAPGEPATMDDALEDEVCKCDRCNGEYHGSDLIPTDLGWLCQQCIEELRSRDEPVTAYK